MGLPEDKRCHKHGPLASKSLGWCRASRAKRVRASVSSDVCAHGQPIGVQSNETKSLAGSFTSKMYRCPNEAAPVTGLPLHSTSLSQFIGMDTELCAIYHRQQNGANSSRRQAQVVSLGQMRGIVCQAPSSQTETRIAPVAASAHLHINRYSSERTPCKMSSSNWRAHKEQQRQRLCDIIQLLTVVFAFALAGKFYLSVFSSSSQACQEPN